MSHLRELSFAFRVKRDELGRQISDLQKQIASAEPSITPEKIERVAVLLRDKLHDDLAEMRQERARITIQDVRVITIKIRSSGSKRALAEAASCDTLMPSPAVFSLVGEWRAPQCEDGHYNHWKILVLISVVRRFDPLEPSSYGNGLSATKRR